MFFARNKAELPTTIYLNVLFITENMYSVVDWYNVVLFSILFWFSYIWKLSNKTYIRKE